MSLSHGVVLLPGGVLPADLAYGALIERLGGELDLRPKDLEVYRSEEPPAGFTLEVEADGIRAFADAAGFEQMHIVGYSGGGASALAFCSRYPDRLISLVLNEPAWAGQSWFEREDVDLWRRLQALAELPDNEMMSEFVRLQLRDGVEPPPSPAGPPPPWLARRPAGVRAFIRAFETYEPEWATLQRFSRPVLYTLGGRSNPDYFERQAAHLARVFPRFRLEVFAERHHFDPPHRVEPERMASLLLEFWQVAEAGNG